MDWFSWLSKTGLEPSLVYEYGLLFSHNELEEDDISHFNHEFLQSMGISIAKHRLEILKLARERGKSPRAVSRLLAAIKKTKKCLTNYIQSFIHRDNSAIVVVPKASYGNRWRGTMLKRNKKLVLLKQGRLLLTDGGIKIAGPPSRSRSTSPMVYKTNNVDDRFWGKDAEEIRWDCMFQNLKPT